MIIERNGKSITLTQEEVRAAFAEMGHQYLMEDAKNALSTFLKGNKDTNFENLYGFPVHLATRETSPYYMLERAVEAFSEQQDETIANKETWNRVISDMLTEAWSRHTIGKVPFTAQSLVLADTEVLEDIRILSDDDYQTELDDGYINFQLDTGFLDADKAFGLFCNTEQNDDYVNVYVNWYADPEKSPEMSVYYIANKEERSLPVVLTAEQQEILKHRISKMCQESLQHTPEQIWIAAQKDDAFNDWDDAVEQMCKLGYTMLENTNYCTVFATKSTCDNSHLEICFYWRSTNEKILKLFCAYDQNAVPMQFTDEEQKASKAIAAAHENLN